MTRTSVNTVRRLRPSRRVLATCLIALLVALAGCSGILGGDNTSPTATDGASGSGSTDDGNGVGTDGGGSANGNDDTGNAGDGGSPSNADGTSATGSGDGTAADGGDDTASGPARIRLAHMSPDAPALDLYIDNETVLTNVSVGAISEYTEIEPGTHVVRITDTDDPESIAFNDTSTFDGGAHTIKTIGEWTVEGEDHIAPYLLDDNNTPAGQNTAKVRLVHTSPDAPTLDVTTTNGTEVFDNVSLTDSTSYVSLSPGEYTLQIREEAAGNDGDVLTTTNISVRGGGVYTAFAAGYLTPDDEPADMSFRIIGNIDTQPGSGAAGSQDTNATATG